MMIYDWLLVYFFISVFHFMNLNHSGNSSSMSIYSHVYFWCEKFSSGYIMERKTGAILVLCRLCR